MTDGLIAVDLSGEEWRPFGIGHFVSNLGRVKTSRARGYDRINRKSIPSKVERLRKPSTTPGGHKQVSIRVDGKVITYKIHRVVLETFVGPCPAGCIACHNNGIPSDNRVENLRWDTVQSNRADWSALDDSTVWSVLSLLDHANLSYKAIADMLGTTESAVQHIKVRRSWKTVTAVYDNFKDVCNVGY